MNFQAFQVLAFLTLGAGFGGVYLSVLAWNVRLYCGGSTLLALVLHSMRLLITAAIFAAFARTGAVPLLLSFVGFQLTRACASGARFFAAEAL